MQFFATVLLPSFFAAPPSGCAGSGSFFGFPTWYSYLPSSDFAGSNTATTSKCDIVNFNFLPTGNSPFDLLLVGLAIIDILLRIAGLLAFIYTLYGGFQYLTSQGEPDKIKTAQGTITNALIGLAIALVSTAAVTFVGHALG
ncbi:MAG TPA: hypothetical protein VIM53_04425 [Candidatus Saccharimonadales bacterium]